MFIISAASDIDTNQRTLFADGKKNTEMLILWHSLTSGRHACQEVSDWRGL